MPWKSVIFTNRPPPVPPGQPNAALLNKLIKTRNPYLVWLGFGVLVYNGLKKDKLPLKYEIAKPADDRNLGFWDVIITGASEYFDIPLDDIADGVTAIIEAGGWTEQRQPIGGILVRYMRADIRDP